METRTRGKGIIDYGLQGSVGTLADVNPTRLSKRSQGCPLTQIMYCILTVPNLFCLCHAVRCLLLVILGHSVDYRSVAMVLCAWLSSVVYILSQTSFGHISINSSFILTVSMATGSPWKDLLIDTSHILRQSIMVEILGKSTSNHHSTVY